MTSAPPPTPVRYGSRYGTTTTPATRGCLVCAGPLPSPRAAFHRDEAEEDDQGDGDHRHFGGAASVSQHDLVAAHEDSSRPMPPTVKVIITATSGSWPTL